MFGIFIALAMIFGCASHPTSPYTLSVEGKLAVKGRQVIKAMDATVDGIDTLVATNVITKSDAVNALGVLAVGAGYMVTMADWLKVIDEARDITTREQGVCQARALAKLIQQSATDALVPVGTQAARARVAAIVSLISTSLIDLLTAFPEGPVSCQIS